MKLSRSKYYWYVIPSENQKYGIYCDSGEWQEFRFTNDSNWNFGKFTTPMEWLKKADSLHRKIHSEDLDN